MLFLKWKCMNCDYHCTEVSPQGSNKTITSLFQIMTWRRPGDKPLSGTTMAYFADAYMRHSTSMILFGTTLRNVDKIYFPSICDIAIQCTQMPSWWHFQMSFVFQIVNFKHNCECYMVLRHHIDNKLKLFQLSLSEPILPRFTYTNAHII